MWFTMFAMCYKPFSKHWKLCNSQLIMQYDNFTHCVRAIYRTNQNITCELPKVFWSCLCIHLIKKKENTSSSQATSLGHLPFHGHTFQQTLCSEKCKINVSVSAIMFGLVSETENKQMVLKATTSLNKMNVLENMVKLIKMSKCWLRN